MNYFCRICFLSGLFLCVYTSTAFSIDAYIMSSSDIIPYTTCIEGIQEALTGYSLEVINIENDLEDGRRNLVTISKKNPKLIIAVGPQAAFVLSRQLDTSQRVFSMVLNPAKLLGPEGLYPGVSLNIPTHFQIQKIKEAFPNRTKIGIFFSPTSNQKIVNMFYKHAKEKSMFIIAFPIASASEIPAIINSKEFSIDILLIIPDNTLGSTKIVEYVIKESLRRKIPVVGYNSWFAKNGALLSFIIDYRDMGIQTGEIAKRVLLQSPAEGIGIAAPEKIKISVNLKIAKKLDIKISSAIVQQSYEVTR